MTLASYKICQIDRDPGSDDGSARCADENVEILQYGKHRASPRKTSHLTRPG